ncbi:DUF72 domain-containing protein [Flaviaesturariibacter amylovorans]|uniref:DUF72 domain-containing protein n=1 Tax=Flaviaesturariibacter amylovorans TaxID=1084520 RepID=A0ABP8GF54_9BACT
MSERPASFFSGTSNILVPLRQAEYPPEYKGASRLTYYASLFTSVEINATFYKLPRPATVVKWAEQVPDEFRFTLKVPKTITHAKGLQFSVDDIARFLEVADGIGSKKGCLLVQLPPSVKRERQEELEGLLEYLADDADGWRIAVELRDVSWYDSAVYRMLRSHGVTLVSQDLPASATPLTVAPERVAYLRYHGPEGGYRGTYDDEFLQGHAARVSALLRQGKDVYVYFNNTAGGALQNLQTLNALVRRDLSASPLR